MGETHRTGEEPVQDRRAFLAAALGAGAGAIMLATPATVLAGPPGPPVPTFTTKDADPALRAISTGGGPAIEAVRYTTTPGSAITVSHDGSGEEGYAIAAARTGAGTGAAVAAQRVDSGDGVGLWANFSSTGAGHAIAADMDTNGDGDAVLVTRQGSGPGAAIAGVRDGDGDGSGIFAVRSGTGTGDALTALRDTDTNGLTAFIGRSGNATDGHSLVSRREGPGYGSAVIAERRDSGTGHGLEAFRHGDGIGYALSATSDSTAEGWPAFFSLRDGSLAADGAVSWRRQDGAGSAVVGDRQGGGDGHGILGLHTGTGSGAAIRAEGDLALSVAGRAEFSSVGFGHVDAGADSASVDAVVTDDSHISVSLVTDPGAGVAVSWIERLGTTFKVHLTGAVGQSTPLTYFVVNKGS